MAVQIQIRRGTAAQWTSANPTLASGELAHETDTGKLKVGDGSTAWTSLAYFTAGTSLGTMTGVDITAGNGLDITQSNTTSGNYTATVSADLKSNGGIIVDSTELAVDLGASAITGTVAATNGGTGLTSISTLLNSNTTKSDVGLGNVENTALSTFSGTSNITTVGTISSGTWSGTAIDYDDLDNKPTLGTAAAAATGDFVAASAVSTFGGTLIDDADAAAARTTLGGTTVGSNVFTAASQAAARSAIGVGTGTGDMVGSNNLSEITSESTARTNLGIGNVENTAISTFAGSSNITTLGTIATGVWNGTAIAYADVSGTPTLGTAAAADTGTGSTNVILGNDSRLTDARTPTTTLDHDADKITTGELVAARGGTGLSSISTLLNSNTTKSDVGLSNVENTALSTFAGTSNITTVGTIATGVWNGTTIAAANGGTGLTSISTLLNSNTTKSDVGLGNVTNIVAFAASDVSTFGATLVDDADAAAARTTLGVTNTGSYTGQIETAADKDYILDPAVATARTISAFYIKVNSGSGTVVAKLYNGSDLVKQVTASTSTGNQTSLANTSLAADAVLKLEFSSNASATDVIFSVEYTE